MQYFINGVARKFQTGGEMEKQVSPNGGGQQEMIQQIAALIQQQGPEAALQALVQQGASPEEAQAIVQKIMQMMQGQAQSARQGAMLTYIKRLRNKCPEGYEMGYYKAGGKVCSKCMKKGNKMTKTEKCGGKMKK